MCRPYRSRPRGRRRPPRPLSRPGRDGGRWLTSTWLLVAAGAADVVVAAAVVVLLRPSSQMIFSSLWFHSLLVSPNRSLVAYI